MNQESPAVLHLITRLLRGGAEAKTIDTVLGLDDYEFTVGYGAAHAEAQINRLRESGVETRRFPLIRHYDPISAIPAVASVARHLRGEDYDIVHTHSTEAGIIGRFAAALAGVENLVHTVHGVPFTEDRNAALNQFILACERRAAEHTDRIITNADIIAEAYLKRGIGTRDQYSTIYSGVDLDEFRAASPATDLPGARPRVVMIGRLVDGKGFEVLLDAAAEVSDSDGSVCLVGDGPLRASLEEAIEARGLGDTVFLVGYREDVPSVLAASDVLALSSFREGTPRAITEAMASGLPVVGTDVAGIPEQVVDGESGWLVPPGDPALLAERLSELLGDVRLRERMGARGSERAERFSVERMLKDLDALYDGLIHGEGTTYSPGGNPR